jgi:hypothetical protein
MITNHPRETNNVERHEKVDVIIKKQHKLLSQHVCEENL